ncbi:MAG: hypothetical protein M1837_006765 [Sclerophora amabilis]|nr:MAG: hypothetical protein M1837_006765 [Sclerophora amabilis]
MRVSILFVLITGYLAAIVAAWDKEDHEVFRLRDQVAASEGADVTFYDFLEIKPSASQEEINKAYRKKSRLLHPDKAKAQFIAARAQPPKPKPGQKKKPGVHVAKPPSESEIAYAVKQASDRFARLGVVTNILRGEQRERYDHFLKNGFPRWRGTGYYYARFRPGLGSVLLGLFIVGGGGAHYGAMYLSWKRQREFVGRYVRHARRAAWGDESGIKGLPSLDIAASTPGISSERDDMGMQGLNRKQRRMQEKETKRGRGGREPSGGNGDGKVPESAPRGERKKVVAENGKVLIVDSTGNVYLEEENEDGVKEEYLLDVDEIQRPTIGQTVLFRLPLWIYHQITSRAMAPFSQDSPAIPEDIEFDPETEEEEEFPLRSTNGNARKRNKRNGKAR